MQNQFTLFRRGNVYYCEGRATGLQKSLQICKYLYEETNVSIRELWKTLICPVKTCSVKENLSNQILIKSGRRKTS
jgi:hypothetical protein